MKKLKIIKYSLITLLIIILVFLVIAYFYLNDYYKATEDVNSYLHSKNFVNVTLENNVYFFDGSGEDDAIVFYQGGKVENIAYAPILFKLAENGIDCFLVKMPFNLAIFDVNAANKVISKYNYKRWYMMGHSLGGVEAASYTSKHKEQIAGLILLASYSTDKIDDSIRVLSIYGSQDGVLNLENYEDNRSNLSINTIEVIIPGGNHAYFGNYGEQSGDNKAEITRDEQQEETIKEIIKFIKLDYDYSY